MDLALLVDRQGEMLDQIEYQVSRQEQSFCMSPRVPCCFMAQVGARFASGRLCTIGRRQHLYLLMLTADGVDGVVIAADGVGVDDVDVDACEVSSLLTLVLMM